MNSPQQTIGMNPISKIRAGLAVMLLLVLAGMLGFTVFEGMEPLDSLYMTVITLSTVGFGEVSPLHAHGKILAIGLITVGFFVAAGIITSLGQIVVEGQFRELVVRRKMETKLKKLSEHCIVAGLGRVGRHVAGEFASKKVPFVVIESEQEAIQYAMSAGYLFVNGDATDEDVLNAAGIMSANTLISTLPQEAQNVYLTLTARDINPDLSIIARADFEEGEKKLMRAGADHVVIPHVLGGIRMAKAALQPNVVDFMHITALGEEGLVVEEMVIPEGSALAGRTLMESGLKQNYGVTIIGIKHQAEKMKINPVPQTELHGGDIIVLLGDTRSLERLGQSMNV